MIHDLILACEQGNVELVKQLLNKDVDVNGCYEESITSPLHVAAANDHLEVVKELLMKGASVDLPNKHGWTALMQAAFHGHSSIVAQLICNHADVNKQSLLGASPIHLAAAGGHLKVCQQLVKAGCKRLPIENCTPDISYEFTPLMCAAQYGNDDVIKYLLDEDCFADISYATQFSGVNALTISACSGHMTTCQLLVERGANPDHTDFNHNTALQIATLRYNTEVKAYLERKTKNKPNKGKSLYIYMCVCVCM